MIASAHVRKERHVFAHHGEVVARVVEVEDALVIVIFWSVIVIWKQVDADRCAVHHCVGKRRNGVQRLVLRVQFRRGNRGITKWLVNGVTKGVAGGAHAPHDGVPPKDAHAVEPRRDRDIRQSRRVLLDLALEKQRLVVHRGLHVVLVMPRPKHVAHDLGAKRELRIAIRVRVVNVARRVQAVAHERVKSVGVARNAFQNGVHRERHGVVHVNHHDVPGYGTYGSPHPSLVTLTCVFAT